ncbi:MAG: cupin domain-containing protein [Acidobacteriota bacterium]|nr:MAG: cupin domain-containing protein [Acidobacteriota bacterium]
MIDSADEKRRTPEVVKNADAVERQSVTAGCATRMQLLLGPTDGAPHFFMRRFVMGPGGGMPLHTNTVEHEQYVLRGRARIRIGDRIYEVGASDVLFIPAGTKHSYEVVEAPFEFLCLVPNELDEIEIVSD